MNTISNDVWKRQGSSILFDQQSLAPFISSDALISLRIFLQWQRKLPNNPPVPDRTILISGLETILETLNPEEANDFLIRRIRPLLIDIQNRWTHTGVVFGFSTHPKAFEETSLNEEVLFKRRDKKNVRLSEGLWDGSATVNMRRVVIDDTQVNNPKIVGYYVARIS